MCRGLAWQEPPAAYSARKRIAEKRVRGKQKHDGAIPSCLCFFMILAVLSHNATIYYQLHLNYIYSYIAIELLLNALHTTMQLIVFLN